MNIDNATISGLAGLIAGIFGSLFAPWIHWGIEKRKVGLNKRMEMIKVVRIKVQEEEYDRVKFRETPVYSQIKPFLDKKIIFKIEEPSNEITVVLGEPRGSGVQNYKNEILDNLTRLERKWKLI